MPHEMLNSMRTLREDMRQRLMQVPEYRALMALDRSIEEICDILRDTLSLGGPQGAIAPVADGEPMVAQTRSPAAMPAHAPQRQGAIATAFAESLAARLDQRGGLRGGGPYQTPPGHRGG